MKLIEHQVVDFTALLASDAPAPGGGSVSALMGAVGASLVAMVAGLTLGKEKYREFEAQTQLLQTAGARLQRRFLELIDLDTEAFNEVSAAYKLRKASEDEKAARRNAIERALQKATKTPFAMMETAAECLQLVAGAVATPNASAASDLGVAAYSLRAAVHGAWLNVLINVGGIKDVAFVAKYKTDGQKLLADSDQYADTISRQIVESL